MGFKKRGLRTLRSSCRGLLSVPDTGRKYKGDRAFAASAPRLWNDPPKAVRSSHLSLLNPFLKHPFIGELSLILVKFQFPFNLLISVSFTLYRYYSTSVLNDSPVYILQTYEWFTHPCDEKKKMMLMQSHISCVCRRRASRDLKVTQPGFYKCFIKACIKLSFLSQRIANVGHACVFSPRRIMCTRWYFYWRVVQGAKWKILEAIFHKLLWLFQGELMETVTDTCCCELPVFCRFLYVPRLIFKGFTYYRVQIHCFNLLYKTRKQLLLKKKNLL